MRKRMELEANAYAVSIAKAMRIWSGVGNFSLWPSLEASHYEGMGQTWVANSSTIKFHGNVSRFFGLISQSICFYCFKSRCLVVQYGPIPSWLKGGWDANVVE